MLIVGWISTWIRLELMRAVSPCRGVGVAERVQGLEGSRWGSGAVAKSLMRRTGVWALGGGRCAGCNCDFLSEVRAGNPFGHRSSLLLDTTSLLVNYYY